MIKFKGMRVVSEDEEMEAVDRVQIPQPEKQVIRTEPVEREPKPVAESTANPLFDPSEPHDDRTPEERIASVEAAIKEASGNEQV